MLEEAVVIIPWTVKIEFKFAKGKGKHGMNLKKMDAIISKGRTRKDEYKSETGITAVVLAGLTGSTGRRYCILIWQPFNVGREEGREREICGLGERGKHGRSQELDRDGSSRAQMISKRSWFETFHVCSRRKKGKNYGGSKIKIQRQWTPLIHIL